MSHRRHTASRWLRAGVALLLLAASATAFAQLQVEGTGARQRLVRDQFSAEQQRGYDLFASKCTKCHAMSRPIAALTTGVAPVTGAPFDRDSIKKYVARMMRKPNSGIRREDARTIAEFLLTARALAARGPR